MARVDHAAVHVADEDRRHVARGHGHHRFVEQRGPAGDLAERDQRAAQAEPAEGDEVAVAEPLADRDDLLEDPLARLPVTLETGPEAGGQQHVTQLDAVPPAVVEQSPSARDPAAGARGLVVEQEADRQPEGAARGAGVVPAGEVLLVRAGPEVAAFGIFADEPRGGGELLEIGGVERGCAVGGGETLEGLGPGALGVRGAGAGECIGRAGGVGREAQVGHATPRPPTRASPRTAPPASGRPR